MQRPRGGVSGSVFVGTPALTPRSGFLSPIDRGGGEDSRIYLGVFLELLLIIANVGTAVVVFPIARRQNEILALGYVTARIMECVLLAAGVVFVLGS
jgi:hypothetical protein